VETLLIYLLVGAFVGLIAGLLGVGGGLIIVPVLVFVFQGQGVDPTVIVHLAIGTSLATIAITSISSMRAHHRHGAVQWDVFRRLTPGIVVGALLGAVIADFLPTKAMRLWFGIFELLVAPRGHLPGALGTNIAGGVIGAISAALGIGGGTLTTPFMVWCNFSLRQAVATSSACGLPIALAGAAGFVATGWNEPGLPGWSSGYLYWPAFAGIVISSLLFAPLGAKLTHTLPVSVLRRFFAIFLAVLGVRMLIG
jgi:hypothetical protein